MVEGSGRKPRAAKDIRNKSVIYLIVTKKSTVSGRERAASGQLAPRSFNPQPGIVENLSTKTKIGGLLIKF